MAVKSWSLASTGGWATAARWTPAGVPAAGDTVIISVTGTAYSVTYNTSISVSSLTISSASATLVSIGVPGTTLRNLSVTGATTLSGGNIDQSSAVQTITTGSLTINSSTSTLTESAGSISVGASGATISNGAASLTGGTFTDSGDLAVSGGTFTISNTGSVTGNANFTGGTDTVSGGTFNVGTLTVGGGSTLLTLSGGTVTTGAGGASIAATDQITISGTAILDATTGGIVNDGTLIGSSQVKGAISGSGTVEASGGTLDLTSAVGVAATNYLVADTGISILELDGAVTVSAPFTLVGTTGDALELNDVTASSINFVGVVSNLSTSASPSPDLGTINYINVEDAAAQITSVALTSNTTLELFHNATDLGTITLGDSAAGKFANWGLDSSLTGHTINNGTDIWLGDAVCYAAGTRILTADGEKAVEEIAAGDMVVTLAGEQHVSQPVKWVGERRINIAAHPRPELVAPVRIRRGAFGEGLPQRDLVVSPDHCLFVDGKLIPAKLLINDMTIVQERGARSVHYYHVELDRHAVLLAEGLPAESYLDTGNRAYFSNSGLALVLHPEFHVNAGLKCWEADACAPLAVSVAAVKPVWRELAARAESLGYTRPAVITTDDADLRLVADGRTIRPVSVHADRHVFVLPAGVSEVRLASRAAIPSDSVPYLDDWRRLGVAVKRIVIRSDSGIMDIPADHPALTEGWYKAERDSATLWRWMDGDARLPLSASSGPVTVEVHVGITTAYKLHEAAGAERIAA